MYTSYRHSKYEVFVFDTSQHDHRCATFVQHNMMMDAYLFMPLSSICITGSSNKVRQEHLPIFVCLQCAVDFIIHVSTRSHVKHVMLHIHLILPWVYKEENLFSSALRYGV